MQFNGYQFLTITYALIDLDFWHTKLINIHNQEQKNETVNLKEINSLQIKINLKKNMKNLKNLLKDLLSLDPKRLFPYILCENSNGIQGKNFLVNFNTPKTKLLFFNKPKEPFMASIFGQELPSLRFPISTKSQKRPHVLLDENLFSTLQPPSHR